MTIPTIGSPGGLFDDPTQSIIEYGLSSAGTAEQVDANDLANQATPGFHATRLDFQSSLAAALATGDPSQAAANLVGAGGALNANGNDVDVTAAMSDLQRNGMLYQALAEAVSNRLELVHIALGQ
ncbi:MAG TPA: hypothetical protein VG650_17165 [Mycobacteriales bacterium]|nr:hypothetical protein [Mycobacteriales bacterium]